MSGISQLRKYVEVDKEKIRLLEGLRPEPRLMMCKPTFKSKGDSVPSDDFDSLENALLCDYDVLDSLDYSEKREIKLEKYCPKCQRQFGDDENICPDCLVILKKISDIVDIKSISREPNLEYVKGKDSGNILTSENIELINTFDFTIDDFKDVLHSIRAQAFANLDGLIRDNGMDLDDMDVLDKIILFAKSFVNVEYKSYGEELGYFEFDKIYVDDRQRTSLQITTIIHELSHFLIKEILTRTVCEILDCTKNRHVESVVTYILTYSVFNNLIDEYAAHSVEGRFTIFGYQDYSSFIALQSDLDPEHIDIAKTIGNTFSIYIKDMLEGFIDWDLREEIKNQFLADTIEKPNYAQLSFESCNRLNDEGFMKAIWLILSEGFQNADAEVIESYEQQFTKK